MDAKNTDEKPDEKKVIDAAFYAFRCFGYGDNDLMVRSVNYVFETLKEYDPVRASKVFLEGVDGVGV
jgi:adenine-specific DNA methylase